MTREEFNAAFEIISNVKIPDEEEKLLVKLYYASQAKRILRMKEVFELSRLIDEGIEEVRKGELAFLEIVEAIFINPIITMSVRLPGKAFDENLREKMDRALDDFPEFIFDYFKEKGIDLVALAEMFFSGDKDDLRKFEQIMRDVNLGDDSGN
jgi:hypothetical protein